MWPSWAFRPSEPYGFRGLKAVLNHAHALVSACHMSTDIRGHKQHRKEKVLYKPREKRSLKRYQIFRERAERWRIADDVGRGFQILAAREWKDLFPAELRLVVGTFNSFFTAGSKRSRQLVGVKQF